MLFADDTAYMTMFKSLSRKVINKIKKFLKDLSSWAYKWRVTLAPNKSNYMIFTRNKTIPTIDLEYNGIKIETSNEIKFLGLG